MIPFREDIESMDDVKAAYPQFYDKPVLNKQVLKSFIRDELEILVEDEQDRCGWAGERKKSKADLRVIYLSKATAKATYHYWWSIDHILCQMGSWGWKPKDLNLLIRQMTSEGANPYSTTEDTVGDWIYALKDHGYKVVTAKGREFRVYSPKE